MTGCMAVSVNILLRINILKIHVKNAVERVRRGTVIVILSIRTVTAVNFIGILPENVRIL